MNAVELKDGLHATLIGEPTGGDAGGYGEVKTFTLPNSKLIVRYTSKYFGASKAGSSLKPELAVPRTFIDELAGPDAALEAAIAAAR
jgi:hypothetical protein